eukprot:TRINITY_DN1305_c0_g1_i1.p1 TRINITY_DN1305_c0_g1~~TRINITY_DN1305_c0_g1_i1.p1  ORF type:complete len:204 (+),score=25.77 TRINITY_DN1305_c0_g1_i1:526-1137(+)
MGGCCCRYSRDSCDCNYQSSRCCCRVYCFPSCLGCWCGMFNKRREQSNALSSMQYISSSASAGILVVSSLEASTPDTYQAPPMPLPYERQVASCDKCGSHQCRESESHVHSMTEGINFPAKCQNLKPCNLSLQMIDKKLESPEIVIKEEEDVCPICLEGYNKENPRIITNCEHHFHLACVMEWMERSDNCPMCYQESFMDESF